MLTVALTLALSANYAATPQAAALQAVSLTAGSPPTVVRTNVVGRFAAVLTNGGKVTGFKGIVLSRPVLLEHFSFGWQPLAVLTVRCDLYRSDAFRSETALMQGMPKLPVTRSICRGHVKDAGPEAQVEAVRSLMRGPLIPSVIVAGRWALGTWNGAGGGQSLYRHRGGRWNLVATGDGAMYSTEMLNYGVPQADWCAFGIYDCKNAAR